MPSGPTVSSDGAVGSDQHRLVARDARCRLATGDQHAPVIEGDRLEPVGSDREVGAGENEPVAGSNTSVVAV